MLDGDSHVDDVGADVNNDDDAYVDADATDDGFMMLMTRMRTMLPVYDVDADADLGDGDGADVDACDV